MRIYAVQRYIVRMNWSPAQVDTLCPLQPRTRKIQNWPAPEGICEILPAAAVLIPHRPNPALFPSHTITYLRVSENHLTHATCFIASGYLFCGSFWRQKIIKHCKAKMWKLLVSLENVFLSLTLLR